MVTYKETGFIFDISRYAIKGDDLITIRPKGCKVGLDAKVTW